MSARATKQKEAIMINYISGDILTTEDEWLVQGVAAGSQEGLGSGLALKISTQ